VAMERTESRDLPSGPPRLPLAVQGGKPSWREREATRGVAPPSDTNGPPSRATPPTMERTESNSRAGGPPRLNLSGGKPSWREREAARIASGGAAPSPEPTPASGAAVSARNDAPPAPASTEALKPSGAPGKWVPRHLREKQG
jgi:translation initiation factor 3 subunit A